MIVELTCLGFVVVFCAAVIFSVLAGQRETMATFTKEVSRVLAQADESRKAAWANVEHANSRVTAIAFPQNHSIQRQTSGVIEGAQHKIEPHFANDGHEDCEDDVSPLDPTTGMRLDIERANGFDRPRVIAAPSDYEAGQAEEEPS